MSKINAMRFININYNNNSIRISDECLRFNGESTLISLRNGGGKSVLVQMMLAPFVHKRYRDTADRPFESYFTTSKPSFILVEWALDQGAGYVLTGLMVRRNQMVSEDNKENLDMIGIVSEYQSACQQDIYHLPVVEKGKKEMILKSFGACKSLFEDFKKNGSRKFFCYDMTNFAQQRQYFDKLMEYQIHYREWESIIRKVNQKESGLSELFSDCKDESALVEKWFLESVESKLNKDKNRVGEFQSILEKYAGQYKDNRSKIRRRNNICAFKLQGEKIQELAEKQQAAGEEKDMQENRIAWFIHDLNDLHGQVEGQRQERKSQIEELDDAVKRVEYEELSHGYYQSEDEKNYHISNRDMIDIERDALKDEEAAILNKLHLFICAKQQEALQEARDELEQLRQKILVARRQGEDWEPERKALGYWLKEYYQAELQTNRGRQEQADKQCADVAAKVSDEEQRLRDLEEKILKITSQRGSLESRIQGYGRDEESFNTRYQENLVRNILGMYEPGELDIRKETYAKELEDDIHSRTALQKELDTAKEEERARRRGLDEKKERSFHQEALLKEAEKQRELYEKELEARRPTLKYLNLGENFLFDREAILRASDGKLEELLLQRRNLEREEDRLQKEYRRLTEGRVPELPAEMEKELENLDIHVVYGMEWLKKNGYSREQNQELVRKNPFLPYALILTGQELHKLSIQGKKLFTSFPIPIVEREQIERQEQETADKLVHFSGVSFYVLFNENLLDAELLLQAIRELEGQQEGLQKAIELRKREYTEYLTRRTVVENQEVTKEKWEALLQKITSLTQEKITLEEEIREDIQSLSELQNNIENMRNTLPKMERTIEQKRRKQEDFLRLIEAYAVYEENRETLQKCKKEEERQKENQRLSRERKEKLQDERRSLELELDMLQRTEDGLKEKSCRYEMFEKPEGGPKLETASPAEMEARYEAVTSGLSRELQDLEKQEQAADRRFRGVSDELSHLQKKYHLQENAWEGVTYSRKEETHQEVLLEGCRRKIEQKNTYWNEADKKAAICQSRLQEISQRILTRCGQELPVPRKEISGTDFEAKKNQLLFRIKEEQKKLNTLDEKLRSYDENLTALSEYAELPLGERREPGEALTQLDARGLRNFKGILLRDYNQKCRDVQTHKEALIQLLNQVVRMEEFQDDFYKKPLERLLELAGDGEKVLLQLQTTVRSYDSLMDKLNVDIAVVEKEKDRIVELLEEYVQEIHKNLGRIDQNSTITVREKPIKMLKIQLPSWEENAGLYHLRLSDFVDEVTTKGVALFDKNENAQEFFGTKITTKNLYDQVVGIGNVQIRMYKIEEQREYPITWKEVARNSGGEGFLSFFVILSSLLYYMRRDETDIFADKNEGKVLVMDNPFAQTNAAHLLKPLMDMAKKTNTQLICLTGLSGDSIYNRFDNIYVLNLIAASLRGGMQYLRAEHRRGDEPDTLITSQIEVGEQMSLLF